MGKLHRVAYAGVGSRDPTIREVNIEEFVHVSHDDHVAIEEDDPLWGSLLVASQNRRRSYLEVYQTKPPAEHKFHYQTKGGANHCAPEFGPSVRKPDIDAGESTGTRRRL